jgi:hypothetical protein
VNLNHWGVFFFPQDNFQFKFWGYLFSQPCRGRKKWLVLVDDKKKECRLDNCNSFERMEVNRDTVGRLKSQKNLTKNLFEFGSIISY